MNLKLVKVIIVLPGTVLVYIPGVLIWLVAEWGTTISLPSVTQPRFWYALVLGASGFALAAWTVRLFQTFGEGTPAPWDPTKRLIVLGPYRHVRNPMITSVLLMLGSEVLFFFSWHLAVWMLVFFLGNAIYFPFVEERELERRFGDDYRLYKANVPRWIPRWSPWNST